MSRERTDMDEQRRQAWVRFGVAVIKVDDVSDPLYRRVITAVCDERYGERRPVADGSGNEPEKRNG